MQKCDNDALLTTAATSLSPILEQGPKISFSLNDEPIRSINKSKQLHNESVQNGKSSMEPKRFLQTKYQQLYDACQDQSNFFASDLSDYGQRLYAAHIAWQDFIVLANELVLKIDTFSHTYDFDAETQGNGYRSFVQVTNACIDHGLNISVQLFDARRSIFFRKKSYMKEVEACSQLLSSLCTCLQYLLVLHQWSGNTGDLFACGTHSAEELFEVGETINQYSFYGRCLGFQYGDSIRGVLRFISIGMASYSEAFYAKENDGALLKTTRSLWTSGKYVLNPELRARRIVNISQNAKIDFCKSFWFLAESELMHKLPSIMGSSIKVNHTIEIPSESLKLPNVERENVDETAFVDIPVPSAHLGSGLPVSVRLLSAKRRAGMIGCKGSAYHGWRKLSAPSPGILFHCHGGGFVAQSSKSHELYLRDWAVKLDVPILSVDYSLAPEAPFPRALEEVFYAYSWLLKNAALLGTTAERIVCAGDSAGANLSIGVVLKCIEASIRIPDGLFLAYCPTLVNFVPSPARLLCLMDPLLPFGFMMRCLRAYAAPSANDMDSNAIHGNGATTDEICNSDQEKLTQTTLQLDKTNIPSASSSRRTSAARSPLSSVAENSKWDQMELDDVIKHKITTDNAEEVTEESSDTFASASYHSQTVERTDLPSTECDDSSCVSFEDDSQPIVQYPVEIKAETPKDEKTGNYLDKYLIDTATVEATENETLNNQSKTDETETTAVDGRDEAAEVATTKSEENIFIETGRDLLAMDALQNRIQEAIQNVSTLLTRCTQSVEIYGHKNQSHKNAVDEKYLHDLRHIDALIARSPSEELGFQVPKDPFLSPYYASEEWLKKMPKTNILSLDMDPCLDDCVMFAKKLKRLGCAVNLKILKGLPHGFLNFTMLSHEAMEGSQICIKSIKDLMQLPATNNNNSKNNCSSTGTATTTPTSIAPEKAP